MPFGSRRKAVVPVGAAEVLSFTNQPAIPLYPKSKTPSLPNVPCT